MTVNGNGTTRRHSVLQVGGLPPAFEAALNETFDVVRIESATGLAPAGPEALELAVILGGTVLDDAFYDRFPNIKAVVNFGAGYDGVDVAAAQSKGVQVANTPGVVGSPVADLAIGMWLNLVRGIGNSERFLREGEWASGGFGLQRDTINSRVGIVGLGGIGGLIAQRLSGFPVSVAYHSRHQIPDSPLKYFDNLLALAEWSDTLILSVVGGPTTANLVDESVLAALGPDGLLINVARGSVVDENALVAALQSGAIGGAALDVFAHEPNVPQELLGLENVVLTPHIGTATHAARSEMADITLANITGYFTSGYLTTRLAR